MTKDELKEEAKELEYLKESLRLDTLEIHLGYSIAKLADKETGELHERIKGIRRALFSKLGLMLPKIRLKEKWQLGMNEYNILLKGTVVGSSEVFPGKYLAINEGLITDDVAGQATKEPSFGADAVWVEKKNRDEAIINGYTVVSPSVVISTHLKQIARKYASEILTREELYFLMDLWKEKVPRLLEDTISLVGIGTIHEVLKSLLRERIPITDIITIMEAILSFRPKFSDDIDSLVEFVRAGLNRVITDTLKSDDGVLRLVTFDTTTEQFLLDKIKEQQRQREIFLNVSETNTFIEGITDETRRLLQQGIASIVLIVDPLLRKVLSEKFEEFGLEIVVLSHAEIDASYSFEVLGTINIEFPK